MKSEFLIGVVILILGLSMTAFSGGVAVKKQIAFAPIGSQDPSTSPTVSSTTPTTTTLPPTNTPVPTLTPTNAPTNTPVPSPTPTPLACSTTSTNTYMTSWIIQEDNDNPVRQTSLHADKNNSMRGFVLVDEPKEFRDFDGSGDSVAQPPQFATLFQPNRVPTFTNTYNVNNWIYQDSPLPGSRGEPLSGAGRVSMLGLATTPGEILFAPRHGRSLGPDVGNGSMVTYADANNITLQFTREDSTSKGYTVHIENICTDPNLVTLYNQLDNYPSGPRYVFWPQSQRAAHQYNLPALPPGKVFATSRGTEIRVVIRDSGNFMDPRSRCEWWLVGGGTCP
jgi:hypothetical protein